MTTLEKCSADPPTEPRTAVITGGSRGIGLGLALRMAARGDRVLVTASTPASAARTAAEHPQLQVVVADLTRAGEREDLARRVRSTAPQLDLLVNNAGVQRRVALAVDDGPWAVHQSELDLLLSAPQHLCLLLVPLMLAGGRTGRVVNTTSGGAFVPQPFAPGYSAAKAGLHAWTTLLRHALDGTAVGVTELVPPAVATGLGDPARPHGADVGEFCDAALAGIDAEEDVVGYGPTGTAEFRDRLSAERRWFEAGAHRFPVTTFAPVA